MLCDGNLLIESVIRDLSYRRLLRRLFSNSYWSLYLVIDKHFMLSLKDSIHHRSLKVETSKAVTRVIELLYQKKVIMILGIRSDYSSYQMLIS